MPIEGTMGAPSEASASTIITDKPAYQSFVEAVRQDTTVSRDTNTGTTFLGRYAIPADVWKMWAAAAGYPDARYSDPNAQRRVAEWAANALYQEFENWSLVAVGWRYGVGAARAIKRIYGSNPAGEIFERVMGAAGRKVIDTVMKRMGDASGTGQPADPYMQIIPGRPAGNMTVQFNPEEFPVDEQPEERDAAHSALQGVLSAMADRMAGGRRLTVEDIQTPMINPEAGSEESPSPRSVRPEDTEYLSG